MGSLASNLLIFLPIVCICPLTSINFTDLVIIKNCDLPVPQNGSDGKESACNVGDLGSIPRWGRSLGEGNGDPRQYSCLKNSVDRGYHPWGRKEPDMTERLK